MRSIGNVCILLFAAGYSFTGCHGQQQTKQKRVINKNTYQESIMLNFKNFNTGVVKVKKGMSDKEVLELLGEPHVKSEKVSVWLYEYKKKGSGIPGVSYGAEIEIKDDNVSKIIQYWGDEGTDYSDFEKKCIQIKEGTNVKDVITLLGKPHQEKKGITWWDYDYTDKTNRFPHRGEQVFYGAKISFNKGKVIEIDTSWADKE